MKIAISSETEFRKKTEDLKNRSYSQTSCVEGRLYTFEKKIVDPKKRFFYIAASVLSTLFSLGLAPLFSEKIQDYWTAAFRGKKVVEIDFPGKVDAGVVEVAIGAKGRGASPASLAPAVSQTPAVNKSPTRIERVFGQTTCILDKGSVTEQAVDAIVNAANEALLGGGGIDGRIHKEGGPKILEECIELKKSDPVLQKNGGNCPPGYAVITSAGDMKEISCVIHVVGPRDTNPNRKEKLKEAYTNCLKLADERRLTSIAFCSISTGIFGYPLPEATEVALKAISEFCSRQEGTSLKEVRLMMYQKEEYNAFKEKFEKM